MLRIECGRMSTRKVFEGKHVFVLERGGWQFVERKKAKEAVAVIARTFDGKLIFKEQFRHPVGARVIDWPAGLVGDEGNDDPAETARRELSEETGFTCKAVKLLASGPTSPGITSEIVHLYRATGVRRRGKGEEDISVHLVPASKAESWLKARAKTRTLIDMKVWAGLYFAMKST